MSHSGGGNGGNGEAGVGQGVYGSSLCLCCEPKTALKNKGYFGDAWVGQSVKRLTSAQVMSSRSVSSSPASGSVLTAQSLEPVSDSVSPSLWPSPVHALSLSVSKMNKC